MKPALKNQIYKITLFLIFALVFIASGFELNTYLSNKKRKKVEHLLNKEVIEYESNPGDENSYRDTTWILLREGVQAALKRNEEACKDGVSQWDMLAYSNIAFTKGELDKCLVLNEFLINHTTEPLLLGYAHYNQSNIFAYRSNFEKAIFHCKQAEKIFINLDYRKDQLRTYSLLCLIYYRKDNIRDLELTIQQALRLSKTYDLEMEKFEIFAEAESWLLYKGGNTLLATSKMEAVIANLGDHVLEINKADAFLTLAFLNYKTRDMANATRNLDLSKTHLSRCEGDKESISKYSCLPYKISLLEFLIDNKPTSDFIQKLIHYKAPIKDPLFETLKEEYLNKNQAEIKTNSESQLNNTADKDQEPK